ncbi:DUF2336 domain-containing protein [Oryzibacter oryziterrae]|uniref:DUF2336 domain-containing protein n=1 Tax=Oryzibacter oryziterrae TaxID=2766474 RepID=UPI001F3A6DBA|nr:DUF2336 domain-containing protein [Oryzibacter oryziterrae]
MTSHPFSNGILGLVRNTDAERARTVLKDATALFVSEPFHSRQEIAMYEELALQLMRVTALRERIEIATLLAAYENVPPAVLRVLLQDIYPVASVILEKAPYLPDVELLSLVATAPSSHVELVAARKQLSRPVVEALLNKLAPDVLHVLLLNQSITLPETAIPALVDLGCDYPAIARALAARFDDVQDTDLIELFLHLDGRGRRRVIQALEIAALREFAARRPLPKVPMPDPEKVADLAAACLTRDSNVMAATLANLIGVEQIFARSLLDDQGGEPLAIALRAAGLDAPLATRVILFSGQADVRNYQEVKRLVELFEMVSLRSSLLLADRWRGIRREIPARRGYVPQTQTGTPIRTGTDQRTATPQAATETLRRDRA